MNNLLISFFFLLLCQFQNSFGHIHNFLALNSNKYSDSLNNSSENIDLTETPFNLLNSAISGRNNYVEEFSNNNYHHVSEGSFNTFDRNVDNQNSYKVVDIGNFQNSPNENTLWKEVEYSNSPSVNSNTLATYKVLDDEVSNSNDINPANSNENLVSSDELISSNLVNDQENESDFVNNDQENESDAVNDDQEVESNEVYDDKEYENLENNDIILSESNENDQIEVQDDEPLYVETDDQEINDDESDSEKLFVESNEDADKEYENLENNDIILSESNENDQIEVQDDEPLYVETEDQEINDVETDDQEINDAETDDQEINVEADDQEINDDESDSNKLSVQKIQVDNVNNNDANQENDDLTAKDVNAISNTEFLDFDLKNITTNNINFLKNTLQNSDILQSTEESNEIEKQATIDDMNNTISNLIQNENTGEEVTKNNIEPKQINELLNINIDESDKIPSTKIKTNNIRGNSDSDLTSTNHIKTEESFNSNNLVENENQINFKSVASDDMNLDDNKSSSNIDGTFNNVNVKELDGSQNINEVKSEEIKNNENVQNLINSNSGIQCLNAPKNMYNINDNISISKAFEGAKHMDNLNIFNGQSNMKI